MLTKIEATNFKAFPEFSLSLKKINVLIGPNNSGKSSILALIKLLAQTIRSNDDDVSLLLNGSLADLGTYRDLVFKNHRGKPIHISFEANLTNSLGQPFKKIRTSLSYKYRVAQRELVLANVQISDGPYKVIEMKYSTSSNRHVLEKIAGVNVPNELRSTLSREIKMRHFLPRPFSLRLSVVDKGQSTALANFVSKIDEQRLVNVSRISNRLFNQLDAIDYIGPVRTAPQRTYLFTGERYSRIGASGENVASQIVKASAQSPARKKDFDLLKAVSDWMAKGGMAKSISVEPIGDRHYEVLIQNLDTGEKQNIADAGYGHSQVLPVLVGGYSLKEGSTYLMEQPEIHLHPKAQAALGDFFADLYDRNIQTIVETHSEHLILRLQQHVASGRINPKSIRFFYVAAGGSPQQKTISTIDLDGDGVFNNIWPEGFFPERLVEAKGLALIRAKKRGATT